jgi:hypothetical protein
MATGSRKQSGHASKDDARDNANKRRFVDQSGLEASERPDKGRPRGYNDTVVDVGRRNLPQHHGGEIRPEDAGDMTGPSEGGLRGDRAFGGAKILGSRKKN